MIYTFLFFFCSFMMKYNLYFHANLLVFSCTQFPCYCNSAVAIVNIYNLDEIDIYYHDKKLIPTSTIQPFED
uniref:Secreted protein n=1 Tax=Strongyloides papillosus TaxID=174720 RepID=A0A0N5BTM3_STREA